MACTHITHCPLFPLLNDSLRAWRESYCDSERTWQSCARFRLSAAGEPVPMALLPNGRTPLAMERSLARAATTSSHGATAAPSRIVPSPPGPPDTHPSGTAPARLEPLRPSPRTSGGIAPWPRITIDLPAQVG